MTGTKRKKTLLLDQALLERVRRLLDARTETEAVTRALEAVLRRELQIAGVQSLVRLSPVDDSRIG